MKDGQTRVELFASKVGLTYLYGALVTDLLLIFHMTGPKQGVYRGLAARLKISDDAKSFIVVLIS
jgi:hypothetical protein